MANWIVGLLAAISAGTWLYTKFMRSTGNNTKNSVIAAAALALVVFIVVYTLALTADGMIGKN